MNQPFKLIISLLLLLAAASAFAQADEARALIDDGRLDEARELLGNSTAPDDLLLRGRIEFYSYNFDDAAKLYAQYKRAIKKSEPSAEYTLFLNELETAQNALDRVEKIFVIDSFDVDEDTFFKHYRLPISSGRLISPDEIPFKDAAEDATVAFTNEHGDFLMWSVIDDNGLAHIVESNRLTDGKWEDPSPTPDFFNNGGNADYPFMMADGTTLYFASDGEGSMGGYDIFVASKDPSTGEYLQPQNLGMPYNSPFDDYMLCIDELNGIGWWASDRKLIPGKVTIFVYLLNDLRNNIDPDAGNLTDLASLSDIALTQTDAPDIEKLKKMVQGIKPGVPEKKADFFFPIAAGITYTTLDDFKSANAKKEMSNYLSAQASLLQKEIELKSLRRKYHASSNAERKSLAPKITSLENELPELRHRLNLLRGKIITSEKATF